MSKVFKIIIDSFLIFVIVLLAGYFILRITDVIKIYKVETGSMEYKIHVGDYILLCKSHKYNIGDVVTYSENDYFITHRIIKMENDKLTTKGDANNMEDSQININQIEGKVVYCGGVLNFIINFKFAIIAFLISLYLLSCYFEESGKKIKESEE